MKRINLFAIIGVVSLAFTACNEPSGPIPESFPKKHLIEEFTGQDCGYCPYGMDCVHEYIANDTNWIVVLHHDGYSEDNFTVSGSVIITNTLGVGGAPSITIDRLKTNYGDGKSIVFHPGYLPYTAKSQFETTTYASVEISNTYEPESRKLVVKVSGALATDDYPNLKLTVLLKESGMIDYQADNYNTYEGWQEFRHVNAVRAFMSDAKGDEVVVKSKRYSATYTLALKENWVPENCMVVAFLTEAFKPVVQAAQQPVVDGSKGGADIQHGGVKAVPVEEYYPEPDPTKGPAAYSGQEADTLKASISYYESGTKVNYWTIQAYDSDRIVKIGSTKCLPFALIYLCTEKSVTSIPTGTYTFTTTEQAGTAIAGVRNDEEVSISGSEFYFTSKKYFTQGYLVPYAQWLIADGTLTITEEGWEVTGHARNGADIHLVGSTPIDNKGKASAPKKVPGETRIALPAIEYCE